jgi:hypothetical protein
MDGCFFYFRATFIRPGVKLARLSFSVAVSFAFSNAYRSTLERLEGVIFEPDLFFLKPQIFSFSVQGFVL